MKNMLTTKEIKILAELLGKEALICKKAGLYSRITMDKNLANDLAKICEGHRNNFIELEELF